MSNLPSSSSSALPRVLGPLVATAIVAGTVIGSGIFKKPQSVSENVPGFGLAAVVWILGGMLALFGALAYAEVATLYPRAGGNYVFLREGYGRLFGFLWGWVDFFMIRCGSIAALATLFTHSLLTVVAEAAPEAARLGYWPQRFLTVAVIVLLAAINIRGVRWGGVVQLLITLVKIGSLLFLIALPFIALQLLPQGSEYPQATPDPDRLQPVWPEKDQWTGKLLGGFATALLGVLWAYHGWMNIASVAGEVKNPQRNLPLALLGGVGIVIILYLLVNLSYSLVLSRLEMAEMKQGNPVDTTVGIGFCRRLLGPIGATLAAAAVMCSVFGALNGNLLVGPRLLYAMSEDGLAPRALGEVHSRYRTPALAIAVLAAWSCLLLLSVAVLTELDWLDAKKDHFDRLTDLAMFGAVIFETMAVVSIFVFRRTLPNAERPYRCIGYPVVPALYVLLPVLVLGNMFVNQQAEAVVGVGIVLSGAAVYFIQEKVRKP